MADVIHFHCPACGISLRVPPAAAGFQGPCPRCHQEIIGPDPDLGTVARRASSLVAGPRPGTAPSARTKADDPFSPLFLSPADPALPETPDSSEQLLATPDPGAARDEKESLSDDATPAPVETASPPADAPPAPPEPTPSAARADPAPPLADPTPLPSPDLFRAVFVLSLAVAALVGLIAGYLLSTWKYPPLATTPAPESTPVVASPPQVPPAEIAPAPAPAPPEETSPPESAPAETPADPAPPEPPPSSAIPEAAEAALREFLAAPDWQSRAAHVLHPDRVRPKMERYHETLPDRPTVPLSVQTDPVHRDADDGILIYRVATESAPEGFPVSLVETGDGWKVDWDSFVEFRDDHFQRFATGHGSDTGSFRLFVRNTHYFGKAFPGRENLTAFRLDPPLPDRNHYGFVATGSDLHKTLAGSTEWGAPCAAVLQIARKTHGDGGFHLEITGIVATDWRPSE